jgi:hypothetical protein
VTSVAAHARMRSVAAATERGSAGCAARAGRVGKMFRCSGAEEGRGREF